MKCPALNVSWILAAAALAACNAAPSAAPGAAAVDASRTTDVPPDETAAPSQDGGAPYSLNSIDPADAPLLRPDGSRVPDVVYVPTPQNVVDEMLRIAGVGPGDVLYDLGSGDGRIPITAARRWGTRGVGIDIDPKRIAESRRAAAQAGVADRVEFIQGDMFDADLSAATVVTLYLLPDLNLRLRPTLLQLEPGTRIVSHNYHMGDWVPQRQSIIGDSVVYLWTVPDAPPRLTVDRDAVADATAQR